MSLYLKHIKMINFDEYTNEKEIEHNLMAMYS